VNPLDQATIDPGVRLLVALLRGHGHETTDSDDGRSKPPEDRDMGETPHVHVRARSQGDSLVDVVAAAIDVGPGVVQLTWDPLAPTAIISVVGVADQHLRVTGSAELTARAEMGLVEKRVVTEDPR
jgi:3',5'-cyclic AMP phosphodiesterase CpdA